MFYVHNSQPYQKVVLFHSINAPVQYFENALAYFAAAISYKHKNVNDIVNCEMNLLWKALTYVRKIIYRIV